MFSGLRKRVRVSPATMIACLALVFALSGGAYAAGRYVITSTKQISPKVLASLKGASGKPGANGANGAQGAQGPQGPQGLAGNNGSNGSNGQSVTSTESKTKIGSCKEGGSEFKSASGTTYACNGEKGEKGKQGEPGEPWSVGGTLPSGASEKGTWSADGDATGTNAPVMAAISFGVPLATPLEYDQTHIFTAGTTPPAGCTVTEKKEYNKEEEEEFTAKELRAAPGDLCVEIDESRTSVHFAYLGNPEGGLLGSGRTGAVLKGTDGESGSYEEDGQWAVTAPAES